ncbi:hypothetical protein SAMN05920897_103175 [Alkalispirochaeta americana]|uniref:Divergent polysaccharide deacetylase n=1 Tax=Alkalispirochaeta americana TaxID=159291 RepID=A0A1N6PXC6_9SPIO|nr:divergent polysaccharide deacetylase family protein [Alkalispirochaeta americana]SIQ08947.1 hypothetical protein SAMN05920897_103175 [Alkalispirochaeta americana]
MVRRQGIFLGFLLLGVAGSIAFLVFQGGGHSPDRVISYPPLDILEETRREEPPVVQEDDLVPVSPPEKLADPAPRLYLVLDDAGQSWDEMEMFSALTVPYTVAVLPGLPQSQEVLRQAQSRGYQVILHQPMEAFNGQNPGPGAIFANQSIEESLEILRENLGRYSGVVGLNNHMGSRITSDPSFVRPLLREVKAQELFFLDSLTTGKSVVSAVAAEEGIPVLVRDVFLDHHRSEEEIRGQLDRALEIARCRGQVIMIGHVTVPETARVLIERQDEILREGFRFLPLSCAWEACDASAWN